MMKVNVSEAKVGKGCRQDFSFVASATKLGIADQSPHQYGDIYVSGQILNTGCGLQVSGRVRTNVKYRCVRCLEEFVSDVELPFQENYCEISELGVFGSYEDSETNQFQGDEIDLSPLIRDMLVLAEPLQPICSENCLGLCSACGRNLNKHRCDCNTAAVDPRLSVLKDLFKE